MPNNLFSYYYLTDLSQSLKKLQLYTEVRDDTNASPKSSCSKFTAPPSCSTVHSYASNKSVSVMGMEWDERTWIMFVTREMALRVDTSIS